MGDKFNSFRSVFDGKMRQITLVSDDPYREYNPDKFSYNDYFEEEFDEDVFDKELEADESGFVIKNSILVEYRGPGGDVVIPDGVVEIGYRAFQFNKDVTSVTMSDSVERISAKAFVNCDNLKAVTLGNGVRAIAEFAFATNPELEIVKLSDNLKYIGGYAFAQCYSLTNLGIPNSVTHVDNMAFYRCKNLETFELSPGSKLNNIDDLVNAVNAVNGCKNFKGISLHNEEPQMNVADSVLHESEVAESSSFIIDENAILTDNSSDISQGDGEEINNPESDIDDYNH